MYFLTSVYKSLLSFIIAYFFISLYLNNYCLLITHDKAKSIKLYYDKLFIIKLLSIINNVYNKTKIIRLLLTNIMNYFNFKLVVLYKNINEKYFIEEKIISSEYDDELIDINLILKNNSLSRNNSKIYRLNSYIIITIDISKFSGIILIIEHDFNKLDISDFETLTAVSLIVENHLNLNKFSSDLLKLN